MPKVETFLDKEQLDNIEQVKGELSRSAYIKLAVQDRLKKDNKKVMKEGKK
jgi:metal-responsive CopG/Arc/MetJ family transcriptional regulator